MTPECFAALKAQGYTHIPMEKTILADLDTPLSTYLKVADEPMTFLLESVTGGERWGRYSVIGLPAKTWIEVKGYNFRLIESGQVTRDNAIDDPLTALEAYLSEVKLPDASTLDLTRYFGGLVGYLGYETVQFIEPRLNILDKKDTLNVPDILLMRADEQIVFDNLKGCLSIIVLVAAQAPDAYEKGQARLLEIERALLSSRDWVAAHAGAAPQSEEGSVGSVRDVVAHCGERENSQGECGQHNGGALSEGSIQYGMSEDQYCEAVSTIKDYTLAGDVMQVVPSQRMTLPYSGSALAVYRALRYLNPSPYLYYFNLGDFFIAGSSPEILVRSVGGEVTVRPIAGTRPRGKDAAEDLAFEQDLLADPKEVAEHLMLIDLGRNDLGRIAQAGTVKVDQQMVVERYSHVMHIVSNVTAKLREDCTAIDVYRATFPAGTLSGAPKIRAMEIIDELEPVKRNIYGGAVGYISWDGNMDLAIAIRTAVIKDNQLHIQAGAGCVADSVPQNEWQETLNKGRAVRRAAEMARKGLSLS
jgi:anthranilate synthase component 1